MLIEHRKQPIEPDCRTIERREIIVQHDISSIGSDMTVSSAPLWRRWPLARPLPDRANKYLGAATRAARPGRGARQKKTAVRGRAFAREPVTRYTAWRHRDRAADRG